MRVPLALALALLATACLAAPALAAKIVVPKDQPTIQAAVDAAASFDTIVVKEGDYTENVTINNLIGLALIAKGKVTVTASNPNNPTITVANSSFAAIRGLTIRNPGGDGISVDASSSRTVVDSCRLVDVLGTGIRTAGTGALVRGNKVLGAGQGIRVDGESSAVIDNVVKDTNGGNGIFAAGVRSVVRDNLVDGTSTHGIGSSASTTDLVIRDNVVRNAGADGIRLFNFSSRAAVHGNRIEDSGDDGIEVDAGGSTVAGNLVLRCGGDGIELRGANHRVSDNRIVKPGAHGVHLVTGVSTNENVLEANLVKKSGLQAFRLDGDDNFLFQNRAKKTQGSDVTGTGSGNVFVDNDLLIL